MTHANTKLIQQRLATPTGELLWLEQGDTVYAMGFTDLWPHFARYKSKHLAEFEITEEQHDCTVREKLNDYFQGQVNALDDISVHTFGSEFQCQVWQALRTIPAGETRSYGEQAQMINRAKAVRAVGAANGANPIGLILPCHRVIGANGALTGYAGGIAVKKWLLAHERAHC
ncbi:MAG: methylated-DNA--[protein]-cysteine S-methyltransferase [Spongiibacteraceae bacterium]